MDFWERMRGALDRGAENSKDLFSKARDKAQDLSRTGVLKFELMQLEDQLQKQLAKLGHSAYDLLVEEGSHVSLEHADVKRIVDEVGTLRETIRKKENELKKVREETGETGPTDDPSS